MNENFETDVPGELNLPGVVNPISTPTLYCLPPGSVMRLGKVIEDCALKKYTYTKIALRYYKMHL